GAGGAPVGKTARVGTYTQARWNTPGVYQKTLPRRAPADPPAADAVPLRLAFKPAPGQSDVVLYLTARDVGAGTGRVVWHRPRFEAPGKQPLLLRDYGQFGPAYEVDYPSVFGNTAKYLGAAVEAANNRKRTAEELARRHGLDPTFLKRWIAVLALEPWVKDADPGEIGRVVPAVALDLLEEKTTTPGRPAINGWRKKGTDLPVLVTNSSERAEQ